jgi:N-acyl amino acid synthase of PEP-CTERM/exosortase system
MVDDPGQQAHILEAIYRLRYQVYVNEWGFERPEDHPSGLEKDGYDDNSRHFYASRGEGGEIIGTARIILDCGLPFPIERHFTLDAAHQAIPRSRLAEISRLAISKDFRRRAIDQVIFSRGDSPLSQADTHQVMAKTLEHERRKCEHELIRGIYLLIYRESLRLGLTHWYAVMARGLHVILSRWGIEFQQIGPAQDYHGVRAPYLLSIDDLTRSIAARNPELLKMATGAAG